MPAILLPQGPAKISKLAALKSVGFIVASSSASSDEDGKRCTGQ
jgi:hypothetical protein